MESWPWSLNLHQNHWPVLNCLDEVTSETFEEKCTSVISIFFPNQKPTWLWEADVVLFLACFYHTILTLWERKIEKGEEKK